MIARAKCFPGIDKHGTPTDRWKVVFDFESFDGCAVRNYAFEKRAEGRNVPLAIAQIVNETADRLVRVGAKNLIERPVRRRNIQVPVEDEKGAGNGLDDIARVDFGRIFS